MEGQVREQGIRKALPTWLKQGRGGHGEGPER